MLWSPKGVTVNPIGSQADWCQGVHKCVSCARFQFSAVNRTSNTWVTGRSRRVCVRLDLRGRKQTVLGVWFEASALFEYPDDSSVWLVHSIRLKPHGQRTKAPLQRKWTAPCCSAPPRCWRSRAPLQQASRGSFAEVVPPTSHTNRLSGHVVCRARVSGRECSVQRRFQRAQPPRLEGARRGDRADCRATFLRPLLV
jgi:hypothetical protein